VRSQNAEVKPEAKIAEVRLQNQIAEVRSQNAEVHPQLFGIAADNAGFNFCILTSAISSGFTSAF